MAKEKPDKLIFSKNFGDRLSEAASVIKEADGLIRIISHYDPDGMTSAAILCKSLIRLGKEFHTTLTSKLDDELLESLRKDDAKLYILADMGSGKIDLLETFDEPVLVIDHHATQDIEESEENENTNVVHLNAHLFGIDGAREASASTLCFALAITLDEENWDLATLALAGAVGDRQNLGGFRGFNDHFVSVGVEKNVIKKERTLDLRSETILESLASHAEPYFKGMSGRKRESKKFLKSMRIDDEAELKDLDDEKKRFLSSMLALRLLKQGASAEAIDQLMTDRYWLYDWGMYVDELVALLNACGRRNEFGLGLSAALGSKKSLEKAVEIRKKHKSWIMKKMMEMEDEEMKTMKNIQHFHIDDKSYTGVIAGLGTLYLFDCSKATIGICAVDDAASISARGPRTLVSEGLDLGAACRTAAEACGGAGGGHNIAAGAKVPLKKEKEFLKKLDALVGEQLASYS